MIGHSIAHYRITAQLGRGGMGEVYRALDTKLNREVAVKVLPPAFAADPERMARFTREAHVLASQNHPNIASIYGVEDRALVMELVEGPTLAERIAAGAMPIDEALPVATQIVEALEYAHEKGIVHRDLKPANVKITPEGIVKLLDFGLAKAMGDRIAGVASSDSPTLTMHHTQAGLILGTAAYMSPEQARGKPSDRRADVWAFGAVLYEMLAGRPLFSGEMVADILAAVISQEPKLDDLPSDIRPIVAKCLRKDPRKRWQSMGDVRLALEERGTDAPAAEPAAAPVRSRLGWAGWIAAGALAVSLGLALLWPRETDRPLMRLSLDLGPGALADTSTTALVSAAPVIAPDGSRLVFPVLGREARGQLAVRLIGDATVTPLSGTEGGGQPFFSPDGQWIGFFADGKLKKVSVQGGAAVALCDAPNPRGGSWGEDGTIVAALSNVTGLSRVPEGGGAPQPLTQLAAGEATHRWPQFLPGGKHVLFTSSTNIDIYEDATIDVVSVKSGERTTVLRGGYFGRLLSTGRSTGHLVYVHMGVLLAQSLDTSSLAVRGTAVPVIEDVGSNPTTGAGLFDASATGVLVYSRGNAGSAWPVVWLGASGESEPILSPAIHYEPRISPDGQRLALSVSTAQGANIFVHDPRRDVTTRVSFTSPSNPDAKLAQAWNNSAPVWASGGRHLAYRSRTATTEGIAWIRADGAGEARTLIESKYQMIPSAFSPDGRRLAYAEETPGAAHDLWMLPLDVTDIEHPKPLKPEPFLRTPFDERDPAFSPDGRWIAYSSNESGVAEVYVRPAAGAAAGKWLISTNGGRFPRWARQGQELFFESLDSRIMVARYSAAADAFLADKPRRWSEGQLFSPADRSWDVAPDGKRLVVFLAPTRARDDQAPVHVEFLVNYFDELKRRVGN